MAAPLIPWLIGGGALYGLYKWMFGKASTAPEPAPDPVGPPYPGTPPTPGGGSIKKIGGLPEGTEADYNEGYAAGKADVLAGIAVGHLYETSFKKTASVRWQKGYRDAVDYQIEANGLSIDEDGNIS